jgi:hypothetical protein
MSERIGEIRYKGDARVRPYRRGTYLGDGHLEQLIERALGDRYSFGQGWRGFAVVSIELYEQRPNGDETRRTDGGFADTA